MLLGVLGPDPAEGGVLGADWGPRCSPRFGVCCQRMATVSCTHLRTSSLVVLLNKFAGRVVVSSLLDLVDRGALLAKQKTQTSLCRISRSPPRTIALLYSPSLIRIRVKITLRSLLSNQRLPLAQFRVGAMLTESGPQRRWQHRQHALHCRSRTSQRDPMGSGQSTIGRPRWPRAQCRMHLWRA